MPPWLQVVSTIVAASFTIGTLARGIATWVWANTIKRDLADLKADIERTNKRIDNWDGSEIWGQVEVKVGDLEVDLKLFRLRLEYVEKHIESLGGVVTTLSNNFNNMRERRRDEDYRKQS